MSFATYQKAPLSSLLALATSATRLSESRFSDEMIKDHFFPSPIIKIEGYSFAVSFSGGKEALFINFYNGNQGDILTSENMDSKSLAFAGDYVRSVEEYFDLIQRWSNFPIGKEQLFTIQMIATSLFAIQERIRRITK
jgi:hypothetical protein